MKSISARLCVVLLCSLSVNAETYRIREADTPVGYLRDTIDATLPLTPNRLVTSARPAMALNFFGQGISSFMTGVTYLWLPAPAYGFSAGYHALPSGFVGYAINNSGAVAGVFLADQSVAVWTNGVSNSRFRNLGGLPGYERILNVDMNFQGVVAGTAYTPKGGDSFVCAAFIAGPTDTALRKMFPGTSDSTAVSRMNSSADVVGLQFPNGSAPRAFYTTGGDTMKPGDMKYLGDLDLNAAAIYPELINNWGDMAGLRFNAGPFGGPVGDTAKVFTYAPHAVSELPSSYNVPQIAAPAEVYALNARAQLLCRANFTNGVYQNGQFQKLEELLPGNPGWTNLWGTEANDNGWILGTGTHLGAVDHAFLMIPVGLDISASVPPEAGIGGQITYSVTLSNSTRATFAPFALSNVKPTLQRSDDVGLAVLVDGPQPTNIASLAPGAAATFNFTFKPVIVGPTRIFSQGSAMNPAPRTPSFINVFSDYTFAKLQVLDFSAGILPDPRQVDLNQEITVRVSALNHTSQTLTGIAPVGPPVAEGTGEVMLLDGPDITVPVTLAPGAAEDFVYHFVATSQGSVNFKGTVKAITAKGTLITAAGGSPPVTIAPKGDLLIKRGSESAALYSSEGVYQVLPVGAQSRTNTVTAGEPSVFQVQIKNPNRKPVVYRLAAVESINTGWSLKYFWEDQDISSQLRTFPGANFPELASNDVYTITVQMVRTNSGTSGADVQFALSSPLAPTATLDTVRAVTLITDTPVQFTLRSAGTEGYSQSSIDAGKNDINAPLVFSTDRTVIENLAAFAGRGAVADGVTPVLLRVEADPKNLPAAGKHVRVETALASGAIAGGNFPDRVRVLQNGQWLQDNQFTLSKEQPAAFLMIRPIGSDEVQPDAHQVELTVQLTAFDDLANLLGQAEFGLRRPPIALIHGYNTTGDWGSEFMAILAQARGFSFVRVARYGQGLATSPVTGSQASINTVWPLKNLAPLAERALREVIEPLRNDWLFTRHDVVAHSQGGLLTRMLCSRNGNNHVPLPFANPENFFRGRFHRVVTIGSPHNGTRLLRYLLALNQNSSQNIPNWVGYGMVLSDTAQAKFDPWGPQIRELNDPSPLAPWAPDPAARFHLVRTSILAGRSYTTGMFECLAFWALGLNTPVAGETVVRQASDGVVDWDSMAAIGPSEAIPPYVYTLPTAHLVCHAYVPVPVYGELFGATAGQVLSIDAAAHVIGALDQDASIPAGERVFAPFSLPPLLDDATRDRIDQLALEFEDLEVQWEPWPGAGGLVPYPGSKVHSLATTAQPGDEHRFSWRFIEPANKPLKSAVIWIPTLYGPDGVTHDGLTVLTNSSEPHGVTVVLAPNLFGDVVLEAAYESSNGERVFIDSFKAGSVPPPNATPVTIEIVPGTGASYPTNTTVPVEIWTRWSDGQRSRHFAARSDLKAVSSAPSIVSVANILQWKTGNSGVARIDVELESFSTSATWSVFEPESIAAPALHIERAQDNTITVSWPDDGSTYQLEFTEALGSNAVWTSLPTPPAGPDQMHVLTLDPRKGATFYRLRKP